MTVNSGPSPSPPFCKGSSKFRWIDSSYPDTIGPHLTSITPPASWSLVNLSNQKYCFISSPMSSKGLMLSPLPWCHSWETTVYALLVRCVGTWKTLGMSTAPSTSSIFHTPISTLNFATSLCSIQTIRPVCSLIKGSIDYFKSLAPSLGFCPGRRTKARSSEANQCLFSWEEQKASFLFTW